MNNIKICTVVVGKTLEEFFENLKTAQTVSELVELRIDYMQDVKIADLQKIKDRTYNDAIVTCRSKFDGGEFLGSVEDQNNILQFACDIGFKYIDIDVRIFEQMNINKKNTKIIISHHDFVETPDESELKKTVKYMSNFKNADIVKIATKVNDEEDNKKLFGLLINNTNNSDRIIIGMGEKGKVTRILGPLLGSYLTFASVGKSSSAPGQIDIKALKEIYEKMGI